MSGVYKHHHDPAHGWMFSLVEVNTVELREGQGERHDDGGARSIWQSNLVPPCGRGTIAREQTAEGDLE